MKRLIVAVVLLMAPAARAAGPPPTVIQADRGVVAAASGDRYLAIPDGRDTIVHRIGADPIAARLRGGFGVPAVAQDGSASGLSADGRTLVLMHPPRTFPAHLTKLAILDARTLRLRERIRLRGWLSFDAISPDGTTLYFIQYRHGSVVDYAVRAYDVPSHTLLRAPIVDPREPDEKMTGVPMTRVQSADGVWAYTLYTGTTTFVHALNTRDRTARCIDVTGPPADPGRATLSLRGRRLLVLYDGTPTSSIDTRTFGVNPPFPPRLPVHSPRAAKTVAGGGGGGPPWRVIGLAAALALAGLAVAVARRRYATGSVSPE